MWQSRPISLIDSTLLVFGLSAVALMPLSGLVGRSTEELAIHSGPRIGSLLNVTMGNAAELILMGVALAGGLNDLVKASIAGSILSNILLVLGGSLLAGGLKNGTQRFNSNVAGISATMLVLAVVALSLEGLFTSGDRAITSASDQELLSVAIALVLLVAYGFYVIYTLFLAEGGNRQQEEEKAQWSMRLALGTLAAATIGAVVMSELIVGSVEDVIKQVGVTEAFLGVILIPIISNAVEHWTSIRAAVHDDMDLSIGIAIGSSLQVALFVAPLLVLGGFVFGNHLQLRFNQYELGALIGAVAIATLVSMDGESNWPEGAQLLAVYVIFALGFFFLPQA